ncbi:hypothetical protein [Marinobacter subterrani]|uniref:hypothetical protein n=1 Tax=Marinobacter subterrani TaxID=1658765 RepID=UPI0023522E92|nr:hypothetical protein [Marinobacter subterrani]
MSDVLTFKPKANLDAEQQAKEYIAFAKRLTKGFDKDGAPLPWGAVNWKHWMGRSLAFSKLGKNVRSKNFGPDDVINDQLIDFAKAYCLHQQSLNSTKEICEIVAIRLVEKALIDLGYEANIALVNAGVMDRAAEICDDRAVHKSEGRGYRIGQQLQTLSNFLDENDLVVTKNHWSNPIPRPSDAPGHKKREEDRKKKMPDPAALDALAEIWVAKPTEPRDIFTTANCLILLSAPGRTNELNELAADCVVWKENTEGEQELFLCWYGQKGYGYTDKPILKTFRRSCLKAIDRIRVITEEPRKLAKWLEENPGEFPKHSECPDVDQDATLTHEQVLAAMCLEGTQGTPRNSVKVWLNQTLDVLNKRVDCATSKVILREALDGMFRGKPGLGKEDVLTLTLRRLNVFVREYWLPPTFPFTTEARKTKFQDALNCYYSYQFEKRFKPKLFSIEAIDNNKLNASLTPAAGARGKGLNIFERWGYKRLGITTHQFRHYLNTLASKGNIGEVERARWSARLDLSQNKTYVHESAEELEERGRTVGLGQSNKALVQRSTANEPILASELGGMEGKIAHKTIYGFCIHDYSVEPCPKFRGCLGCSEHRCIKGDDEKLRRIKIQKEFLRETLETALKGVEEESFGADKWLEDAIRDYEMACELVDILENPKLPDGAVVACEDAHSTDVTKSLASQGLLDDQNVVKLEPSRSTGSKINHDKLRQILGR